MLNLINIQHYFFNDEGEFCCEGTINGIYFQGKVRENRYFEWGTEKDVLFEPEVLTALNETVKALYVANQYLEQDLLH